MCFRRVFEKLFEMKKKPPKTEVIAKAFAFETICRHQGDNSLTATRKMLYFYHIKVTK